MLPLGLVLLAEDFPPVRRGTDTVLAWIERRRPHWMGLPCSPSRSSRMSSYEGDPMNIDAYTSRPSNRAGFRRTAIDAGLRRYMLSVYNYMAVGLGLTGLVAAIAVAAASTSRSPARR